MTDSRLTLTRRRLESIAGNLVLRGTFSLAVFLLDAYVSFRLGRGDNRRTLRQ